MSKGSVEAGARPAGRSPARPGTTEHPDAVARIVAEWARERPDLDASPMLVIGRLHRVAGLLDAELRPVFAAVGLGEGEFDVLASLRRAGDPFTLTPTELGQRMMVTSGAVSKRLDRLGARGLLTRSASTSDGRGRVVTLTPEGRELVDGVVVRHAANEERLLQALTPTQRAALADALSTWLGALEA